jgi:prefoldin subunit 4
MRMNLFCAFTYYYNLPFVATHPLLLASYKIGEAFMHIPHARAIKRLEKDQSALDTQMESLSSRAEDCEKEMAELKKVLYAKFGRAINLDE